MKLNYLILASFFAWVPQVNIHAQNPQPGYTYVVASSDTVKVAYDKFATVTIDSNTDFKIQDNESWIKTQKVSKNNIIIFCEKNVKGQTRTGSVTLTSASGEKIKDIIVEQLGKGSSDLIPENVEANSPVMGWKASTDGPIQEKILLQQTNAIKYLGLQSCGYQFVILDNTTFSGRNEAGNLVTDASQFPNGLKNTLQQISAFQMGIQTSAEKDLGENFGTGLGLMGHEENDCNYWFKELGFNYAQVDFKTNDKSRVESVANTVLSTENKNVKLDVNTGAYPGTWIGSVAHSWHTGNNVSDWASVQSVINTNRYLGAYYSNGHYHNFGTLNVNHQLTSEEEQTCFGLWCMFNSPLVLEGDIEKTSARTLALLKNKELIALNQQATFQQPYLTQFTNGCYVWVKDINKENKNSRAIAVYNTTDQTQKVMVSMENVDLAGNISVHDAVSHKDLADVNGQLDVTLPAHATRIYILEAESRLERSLYEAENGFIAAFCGNEGSANGKYVEDANCSGGAKVVDLGKSKENSLRWNNVESQNGGLYQISIDYVCEGGNKEMTVEVNQKVVRTVKVSDTGSSKKGTLTMNVQLEKGNNTILLSNATGEMPAIDVMKLHPCQTSDLFVEAENFNIKGGWKVDQQFMDIMGSPYLNAHGMGVPVEDATTEIEIPASNTYHVYVRTFNWTSPWTSKEGPGKFQIGIDGKKMETVLGCKGDKWEWQYAGTATLEEGRHALSVHDLTGFNGRIDAIYFNTEQVAPPADVKALGEFRRTQLNIPNTPEIQKEFDLVVCGGGIAGMCTAMAAAREGMKVALINDRPVLGGNNSAEVRVHLGGRIELAPYTNLGNLIKEFGHTKAGNAMPAANYEDDRKMEWILSEKNISLFINNRVNQVHMNDDQIDYVISQNTETGVRTLYKAPLFVDCTGDGTIGALAGADFRMGRESKKEFNEIKGPEQADKMTMGNSDQWYAVNTSSPSSFPIFEYGVEFNENNKEAISKGDWNWENGMRQNQITEFERIRDYGLMVVYSNWSFLKNKYSQKANFANQKLEWVAYIGGKRESRRLMGDYILNGNDIVNHKIQPDYTASTSWSIDLHYPIEKNEQNFHGEAFKSWADHLPVYSYPIPYRCLYSRNVNNLFMAGRNISVSHMALGTTRVMRTTGMIGEVVGLAASVCKKYNALPRDVYELYFEDLKVLMKKGAGKQGLPNTQTFNNGRWLNN